MKYAVTGLPRSRTKWASVFLSTPDLPCKHDVRPDLITELPDNVGLSDPGILYVWELLPTDLPIVYINRNVDEAARAFAKFGVDKRGVFDLHDRALEMFKYRDVLILDYVHLDPYALWKHCHGYEITPEYVECYENMNITQYAIEKLRRVE